MPWSGCLSSRELELFRVHLVDPRVEVGAAAGFVEACCTDDDQLLALAEALGVDRGSAAGHADGGELGDLVGDGHQVGNGAEGLGGEGGVEPGHDNALAQMNELDGEGNDGVGEKLYLVDADDLDLVELRKEDGTEVFDGRNRRSIMGLRAVAGDGGAVVAEIDVRLVAGDTLTGDPGTLEASDQLFGLSGEHGAGDHLDAAGRDGAH